MEVDHEIRGSKPATPLPTCTGACQAVTGMINAAPLLWFPHVSACDFMYSTISGIVLFFGCEAYTGDRADYRFKLFNLHEPLRDNSLNFLST